MDKVECRPGVVRAGLWHEASAGGEELSEEADEVLQEEDEEPVQGDQDRPLCPQAGVQCQPTVAEAGRPTRGTTTPSDAIGGVGEKD